MVNVVIKNPSRRILYPVSRYDQRSKLPLVLDYYNNAQIFGYDMWVCYELSWLNLHGKPEFRIMEMKVPCSSLNIIESKSLKLYLNSFNNMKFSSENEVKNIITSDIVQMLMGIVRIKFIQPQNYVVKQFSGTNLDNLNIELDEYIVDANLIKLDKSESVVEEKLHSHLFRSNCPMTSQPDFASVQIEYKGKKINHKSLLKYLVSFRNHRAFHEQCIEHIFCDLLDTLSNIELKIYGSFARRGGISIIPFRTNINNLSVS